jgi:hypothetical protein
MGCLRVKRTDERGQALITAMIFLLALTFMGFGLVSMSSIDVKTSSSLRLGEEALMAAEEGIFLGLAWASNSQTNFTLLNDGDTWSLNSLDNTDKKATDDAHFEVMLTMLGPAPIPEGEQIDQDTFFVNIRVASIGYVKKRGIINIDDPPLVRRTMEVLAVIKKVQ